MKISKSCAVLLMFDKLIDTILFGGSGVNRKHMNNSYGVKTRTYTNYKEEIEKYLDFETNINLELYLDRKDNNHKLRFISSLNVEDKSKISLNNLKSLKEICKHSVEEKKMTLLLAIYFRFIMGARYSTNDVVKELVISKRTYKRYITDIRIYFYNTGYNSIKLVYDPTEKCHRILRKNIDKDFDNYIYE